MVIAYDVVVKLAAVTYKTSPPPAPPLYPPDPPPAPTIRISNVEPAGASVTVNDPDWVKVCIL
jgi:hypothetical protein